MILLIEETPSEQNTDASWLANRAEVFIIMQQWERARADFDRAIELDPDLIDRAFNLFAGADRWSEAADFGFPYIDVNPETELRWMNVAPVLVLSGDHKDYATFCVRVVEQFTATTDAGTSERATKIALLTPDAITVNSLPARPFVDSLENGTADEGSQPWFWATRALLALRTGDADAAVEYVSRSADHQPHEITRALSLSVLALAQHHQGNTVDAKFTLDKASLILEELKQNRTGLSLANLLIAEVLNREAEAKINGKSDSGDETLNEPEKSLRNPKDR